MRSDVDILLFHLITSQMTYVHRRGSNNLPPRLNKNIGRKGTVIVKIKYCG